MDEEMVAKIHDYESSNLPDRIKLALKFTEGWVMYNAQTIDDDLIAEMRQHFTDRELVELATIVGIYESAHKFNVAFAIERDDNEIYENRRARVPENLRPYVERLKADREQQTE